MQTSRVDDELVARAVAWCSEAGRSATPAEVRAALASVGWDELLAIRALLADAPPARPLGPLALLDVARGVDARLAAEREKEGKYPSPTQPARHEDAPGAGERPRRAVTAPRRKGRSGPVIRRARDRVAATPPEEPARLPSMDELFASEGRAQLERLVREHGARRGPLVASLSAGWSRPDGAAPTEDDLSRLLDFHGLASGFARRERDELLHALRAAAGLRSRAAAALGLTRDAFGAALERLGAAPEARSIEEAHRAELRRRAMLSERVRLLLAERDRLEELGIRAEFEADVRARLPQHVRALRASGAGPLPSALARSLAIPPRDANALAARFGVDVEDGPAPTTAASRPRGEGRKPERRVRRAAGVPPPTRAPRRHRAPKRR